MNDVQHDALTLARPPTSARAADLFCLRRSYPCIYCGPASKYDFTMDEPDDELEAYTVLDNFKAAMANKCAASQAPDSGREGLDGRRSRNLSLLWRAPLWTPSRLSQRQLLHVCKDGPVLRGIVSRRIQPRSAS